MLFLLLPFFIVHVCSLITLSFLFFRQRATKASTGLLTTSINDVAEYLDTRFTHYVSIGLQALRDEALLELGRHELEIGVVWSSGQLVGNRLTVLLVHQPALG